MLRSARLPIAESGYAVRARIVAPGAEPVCASAADFEAVLRADYETTGKLVAEIGLKVD